VNGFGIFLLAVYPGAFTEIHSESLARSTTSQKLRIYGAGIWHNLLLAVVAVGVLYGLPTLLYPLYSMDKGILVTDVASRSGLSGDAGLRPGHVIYAINQCGVRNQQDWGQCVQELTQGDDGYCMANEEVVNRIVQEVVNVYGEMQCCDDANTSLSHLCFFFHNKSTSMVHDTVAGTVSQRPKLMDALGVKDVKHSGQVEAKTDQRTPTGDTVINYACLPARHVTDHSTCNASISCSSGSICVYPALFNQTKLIRFRIANLSRPVLFIGHVNELRYYVRVSDFVPRLSTILAPVWLPRAIDLFCRYLVTFSLAMALLNAVPCFSLDGQYICQTLTEAFCHKWPQRRRQSLTNLILYYGTFLLCANVVIGFFKFFYANYYRG